MRKKGYIKCAFVIISFLMATQALLSQQAPVFGMQRYTNTGINPSYTGLNDTYNLILLTRHQWLGFEGAPRSYYLNTSVPFNNRRSGIGLDALVETAGPVSRKGLFISYSYTVSLSEKSNLSFGIRGGLNSYRIDLQSLLLIDPLDYLFEQNIENKILPNIGAGLHFEFADYYIDFSVPTILRSYFESPGNGTDSDPNREGRSINLSAGSTYSLSKGIRLHPTLSAWFISQSPTVLDIGISAELQEQISFGLIYRSSGILGGHMSYKLSDRFMLGYAYELPLAYDYKVSTGTHEVVLGYNFQFLNVKTLSPRRF